MGTGPTGSKGGVPSAPQIIPCLDTWEGRGTGWRVDWGPGPRKGTRAELRVTAAKEGAGETLMWGADTPEPRHRLIRVWPAWAPCVHRHLWVSASTSPEFPQSVTFPPPACQCWAPPGRGAGPSDPPGLVEQGWLGRTDNGGPAGRGRGPPAAKRRDGQTDGGQTDGGRTVRLEAENP